GGIVDNHRSYRNSGCARQGVAGEIAVRADIERLGFLTRIGEREHYCTGRGRSARNIDGDAESDSSSIRGGGRRTHAERRRGRHCRRDLGHLRSLIIVVVTLLVILHRAGPGTTGHGVGRAQVYAYTSVAERDR